MNTEVDLATQVFEFLEDDYQFEYHLKTVKEIRATNSVITYYKDNTTVKLTINHSKEFFNINIITEKDNSFTITSFLDKLIYQSDTNSKKEFETGKQKLIPYIEMNSTIQKQN